MAIPLTHPDYPNSLPLTDGALSLDGAISIEPGPSATELRPWRIPFEDLELFSFGGPLNFLPAMARVSSGVRLSIVGCLQRLRLVARPLDVGGGGIYDLVINGQLVATQRVKGDSPSSMAYVPEDDLLAQIEKPLPYEVVFDGLLTGPDDVIEVWLPHFTSVTILAVATDSGASLRRFVDTRPRWITHGSSITQCSEANSPTRTWPATAARMADVSLLSLGFSGQCHLEQSVARIIRSQPADAISLKLGINMHNLQSLSTRLFASNAIGFIQTIREGHPATPIVIISPIFGDWREKEALVVAESSWKGGALGKNFPSLAKMRKELRSVVDLLRRRGDANIYYRSGLDLFSEDDAQRGWLPDALHPNSDGYEHMGRRFAELEFGPAGRLLPGRIPLRGSL